MNALTLHIEGIQKEQSPALIELLVQNHIKIYHAGFVQNTLEDLFIQITA